MKHCSDLVHIRTYVSDEPSQMSCHSFLETTRELWVTTQIGLEAKLNWINADINTELFEIYTL